MKTLCQNGIFLLVYVCVFQIVLWRFCEGGRAWANCER